MAFDHQERNQQIREGQTRTTLHTKPGSRPPFERAKSRTRGGAPKGHDAILKDLQQRAATVEVFLNYELNDKYEAVGTIIASDKFTISLKVGSRVFVLYKHALQGFAEVAVQ